MTGVQTCALPILLSSPSVQALPSPAGSHPLSRQAPGQGSGKTTCPLLSYTSKMAPSCIQPPPAPSWGLLGPPYKRVLGGAFVPPLSPVTPASRGCSGVPSVLQAVEAVRRQPEYQVCWDPQSGRGQGRALLGHQLHADQRSQGSQTFLSNIHRVLNYFSSKPFVDVTHVSLQGLTQLW